MSNAQHSSKSELWYTPSPIIELERIVLGGIDFDPASDHEAQKTVRAGAYLNKADDGLTTPWSSGSIHLNPPGGKVDNRSLACEFWVRFMKHRALRGDLDFTHGIFLAFSLEALQNTQGKGVPTILDFPICVPDKRIRFVCPDGEKMSPTHANVLAYVPGTVNRTDLFLATFRSLGACKP